MEKNNTAFLGDKIFREDKNGNRHLDKDIGRAMIKTPHPINVKLKIRPLCIIDSSFIHLIRTDSDVSLFMAE